MILNWQMNKPNIKYLNPDNIFRSQQFINYIIYFTNNTNRSYFCKKYNIRFINKLRFGIKLMTI